jgi:hypothetical protein
MSDVELEKRLTRMDWRGKQVHLLVLQQVPRSSAAAFERLSRVMRAGVLEVQASLRP